MGSLIQNMIWGRQKAKSFVSTWKTDNLSTGSSTSTQVKLPLVSTGTYNMTIDWGDGSTSAITTWNHAAVTHTYSAAGTYEIKITGTCIGWRFANTGDRLKILSISSWGGLKLGTNEGLYFYGCGNLNLSGVTDVLNLSGTSSLAFAFTGASSLTTINRIDEWNILSISNLQKTFWGCTNFNQNLNSWNTSNVREMGGLFRDCHNFNNGLASGVGGNMTWSVSNVINFGESTSQNYGTFENCIAFNQNLNSWNVVSGSIFITMFSGCSKFNNGSAPGISASMTWTFRTTGSFTMYGMFRNCAAFNQNISSWNMNRCSQTWVMFVSATAFNQNLSSWVFDVSCNMTGMFQSGTNFNNGLASGVGGSMTWTFNVPPSNISSIFRLCSAFNQNINSWNTSTTVDFNRMFQSAINFNNGLASGVVGSMVLNMTSATNLSEMFSGATAFNQNIGSWNVSKVTNMQQMLQSTIAFNQNIGGWNISNVTNFSNFMIGKPPATFSAANLDAIYNGWSSRPVKTPITINFGTIKYTAASSADRAVLTGAPNNWTITDGGI
jgi:surface protein